MNKGYREMHKTTKVVELTDSEIDMLVKLKRKRGIHFDAYQLDEDLRPYGVLRLQGDYRLTIGFEEDTEACDWELTHGHGDHVEHVIGYDERGLLPDQLQWDLSSYDNIVEFCKYYIGKLKWEKK